MTRRTNWQMLDVDSSVATDNSQSTIAMAESSQESSVATDKSIPNFQTSDKLMWSHICEPITIDDDLEREFYAKECVAENWSVDYLHRQKESGLFMRLALRSSPLDVIFRFFFRRFCG